MPAGKDRNHRNRRHALRASDLFNPIFNAKSLGQSRPAAPILRRLPARGSGMEPDGDPGEAFEQQAHAQEQAEDGKPTYGEQKLEIANQKRAAGRL